MRTKKTLIEKVDKAAAEEAFAEFAIADAKQKQITAKMDVEITKIRDRYTEELQKLSDVKDDNFEILKVYAETNRDQFGSKKSMELTHGLIGFRTGTPKLKTRKGFTWNSVTNLLKEFLPDYLRVTEEPAKDMLLANREVPEVAALFPRCGIMVDQDETFFVDPKKEELTNN